MDPFFYLETMLSDYRNYFKRKLFDKKKNT